MISPVSYYRSMADIYRRLASAGLDRRFVQSAALPEDWFDGHANKPEGRDRAERWIEQALDLREGVLAEPDAPLGLGGLGSIAYVDPPLSEAPRSRYAERVDTALTVARRIARLAVQKLREVRGCWLTDMDAEQLREFVVAEHGVVRLQALLDTAWGLGIPVLRLAHLPADAGPIAVATVTVGEVPVILLAGAATAPAWMLWQLATHLGHIALDHQQGGDIVSAELATPFHDARLAAAREFADTLVLGELRDPLHGTARITGVKLARHARTVSRTHRLEAGAIIARFALAKALLGVNARGPAQRALRDLGVDTGGDHMVRSELPSYLDLDSMTAPERRFFDRVTESPD